MSYKEFRATLNIGSFVDDIYVEVRNNTIVAFIDAHDRRYPIAPMETRIPLLEKFSEIAPSYYMMYTPIVDNTQLTTHPDPLNDIVIHNMKGDQRNFNTKQLKGFIESLGSANLANKLPRPPRYPDSMSSYSVWHYTLDYNCLCRDIDFTEFRNGNIVCFIETTGRLKSLEHLRKSFDQIRKRLDLQITIMNNLSTQFNVPSFIVIHLTDLSYFEVYDLNWNRVLEANQEEYIEWLTTI